jgi:hypothetical protein
VWKSQGSLSLVRNYAVKNLLENNMTLRTFAAALIVLATPVAAQDAAVIDGSDQQFEATIIKEMIIAVTYEFFDPASATFRELIATDNGRQICGYVNAKNRFGGYVGFQPFLYDLNNCTGTVYDPSIGELSFLAFKYSGCAAKIGVKAPT